MTSKLRLAQAVCLGLTLTFVPAILCVVTVAGGYGVYLEFKDWQRRKRGESIDRSTSETLDVDNEGRTAVAVRDAHSKPVRYLDAERVPITGAENAHWLVGKWSFRSPPPLHPLQRHRDYPIEPLGQPQKDEDWFLVRDNRPAGRAVFEGYDAVTHLPIGFIGVNGFEEGPRDESKGFPVNGPLLWGANPGLFSKSYFDYPYQEYDRAGVRFDKRDLLRVGQWVLQSGKRLLVVDLVARSVTELLPGMPVRSMAPAARIVPAPTDPALPAAAGGERQYEYQKWLAVHTADKVVLMNPNAGRREEYVLPPDWNGRDFMLYLPADGTAVFTFYDIVGSYRDIRPGIPEYEQEVVTISPAGEIVQQTRFTLQVSFNPTAQPSERSVYWLMTLAVPGPLPSALIAGGALPWLDDAYVNQTRFSDRAVVSLGQTWPVLAFVTLMATGLTWLTDRHFRAVREPRSLIWLAFVFLLGLPGYVAWHCHRRWPVRHPVLRPEKTGTEIFA